MSKIKLRQLTLKSGVWKWYVKPNSVVIFDNNRARYEAAFDRIEAIWPDDSDDIGSIMPNKIRGYIEYCILAEAHREYSDTIPPCCCCQTKIDVRFITNPFRKEIYGDLTKEWLCGDCERNAARDI